MKSIARSSYVGQQILTVSMISCLGLSAYQLELIREETIVLATSYKTPRRDRLKQKGLFSEHTAQGRYGSRTKRQTAENRKFSHMQYVRTADLFLLASIQYTVKTPTPTTWCQAMSYA